LPFEPQQPSEQAEVALHEVEHWLPLQARPGPQSYGLAQPHW
jgi:hypothetical protein